MVGEKQQAKLEALKELLGEVLWDVFRSDHVPPWMDQPPNITDALLDVASSIDRGFDRLCKVLEERLPRPGEAHR